jgi:hypothetical protein
MRIKVLWAGVSALATPALQLEKSGFAILAINISVPPNQSTLMTTSASKI